MGFSVPGLLPPGTRRYSIIDILDEFPVEQMKRDSLRTYSAALSAVRTSSGYVEGADDMKHLLFDGIHIRFLRAVKLVAVKYALAAGACRTYISACVAADTFAQLLLEESEFFFRAHRLDFLHFCEAVCSFVSLDSPMISSKIMWSFPLHTWHLSSMASLYAQVFSP